jgi:hypothetical protein
MHQPRIYKTGRYIGPETSLAIYGLSVF